MVSLFRLLRLATVFLIVLAVGVVDAEGQVNRVDAIYNVENRPDSVSYRVLEVDGYDIIYQAGYRASAKRAAHKMIQSEAGTDVIIGSAQPQRAMPVVLNAYNDRSNGFVRSLPFKQEIEIPSIRSNTLTPRFASWFDVVVPHELTHALHAEYNPGFGVGTIMGTFAPDAERSLNLSAPRGWTEGVAVYRESQVREGAGRMKLPAALMSYRAALGSDSPWGHARVLHAPAHTQPFDRHYIGGGQFFRYLVERDTEDEAREPYDFFQRTLGAYHRFPLLGYGIPLWYGTGRAPGSLSREFMDHEQAQEAKRIEALGTLTEPDLVVETRRGLNHRRPLWKDDDTLVAYRFGYRDVPGIYRVDTSTGDAERLAAQQVTGDYHMHLSADSLSVWVSRFDQAATVPSQFVAEVEAVDLQTGTRTSPTDANRLLAPAPHEAGGFWAAENDASEHRLVRYDSRDEEAVRRAHALPPRTRIQQIGAHPTDDERAVALLNMNGDQFLFAVHDDADDLRVEPLVGFEESVIYDVQWGPDGRYLLMSADPTGVPNVFAVDLETETVYQATNVAYGALEPTLSPDRSMVAYVEHQHERHDLVTVPFEPETWETRTEDVVWHAPIREQTETGPEDLDVPDDLVQGERSYRASSYLSPRMVYPTIRLDADELETGSALDETLGLGVGLGLAGADPLQQWAYRMEGYYQAGQIWGEGRVQTSRLWGQPSLGLYRRPFTTSATVTDEEGTSRPLRIGVDERGADLTVQQSITRRSNVYRSLWQVQWRSEFRQTRLFADAIQDTPFQGRITLRPSVQYIWRLQQNTRDLIPRHGVVVGVTPFVDAWTDGIDAGRAVQGGLSAYLPWFDRFNTGVRVGMQALSQNQGAIFNLEQFMPRGYSDTALPRGTYTRADLEVVQPIGYPDRGGTVLPVYMRAFYLYGVVQGLYEWADRVPTLSSSTIGVGARLRLFYNLPVDVRIGATYRHFDDSWVGTVR